MHITEAQIYVNANEILSSSHKFNDQIENYVTYMSRFENNGLTIDRLFSYA